MIHLVVEDGFQKPSHDAFLQGKCHLDGLIWDVSINLPLLQLDNLFLIVFFFVLWRNGRQAVDFFGSQKGPSKLITKLDVTSI